MSLTGSSFFGDIFADAGGIHRCDADGVRRVRLQLLQDDARLLPSNLRLFTGNTSAVRLVFTSEKHSSLSELSDRWLTHEEERHRWQTQMRETFAASCQIKSLFVFVFNVCYMFECFDWSWQMASSHCHQVLRWLKGDCLIIGIFVVLL